MHEKTLLTVGKAADNITRDLRVTQTQGREMKASNLTRYKKAVRAAHKYYDADDASDVDQFANPAAYKLALKLEAKWDELSEKASAILEELTLQEEQQAIDWLAENSFYGYHEEVC